MDPIINPADESGSAPVQSQDIKSGEPETPKEEYQVPYKVFKPVKDENKELKQKMQQFQEVQGFLNAPAEYLNSHPEILQQVAPLVEYHTRKDRQSNPEPSQQQIEDLEDFVTKKDLNNLYGAVQQMMGFQHQAMTIQQKYKDVDINNLYKIAAERRLPDLDTAYQVWKAQNLDSFTTKIKEEAVKEYLVKQTEGLPSSGTGGSSSSRNLPSLSQEEKNAAMKMGLTSERYAEWKKKLNLS